MRARSPYGGAIYNIGFGAGLRAWRRLLRPGGALAVSEAVWLSQAPPPHVRRFWDAEYPAMQSVESNARAVAEAGYTLLESFVLPEREWWEDYYTPIGARIRALRKQRNDEDWHAALDAAEAEEAIIRVCAGSFGYAFFVMRKPGQGSARCPIEDEDEEGG
jgi:hypothetical protein